MTAATLAAAAVLLAGALLRVLPTAPARGTPARSAGRERSTGIAAAAPTRPGPLLPSRLVGVGNRVLRPMASQWIRRRHQAERRRAWPSVADEVAAGLRSGASLHQALEAAAERGGPAGERLRAVIVPVSRGDPLGRTATRWARAATDPDEVLLAEAVQLAATTVRADPMLFDTVADTVRDRAAMAGELRVQTAQARASAMALSVLPLLFTALLAFMDPSVVTFLLATTGGWLCLAVGLGLQTIGTWWMHRIVDGVKP